ncbi:MAG: hypothetical protein LC792_26845 [Actinobacteria bacterium]|nr:hypothetical protein [Actinomycetota bacterium]
MDPGPGLDAPYPVDEDHRVAANLEGRRDVERSPMGWLHLDVNDDVGGAVLEVEGFARQPVGRIP